MSRTVLVVEDQAPVRELAARIIGGLGHSVVQAHDGPSALIALENHPEIDLLFSDLVLPGGVSGGRFVREAQARRPGLMILLTSGYADIFAKDPSLPPGIAILAKPYRKHELVEKLRGLMGERERGS